MISAAIALAGCDGQTAKHASVSGRVTLDGEPVADARLMFVPVEMPERDAVGFVAFGVTDADGRYSLKTSSGRPGATVGRNYVWIATRRAKPLPDGEDVTREEWVPQRYNKQTTLVFVVPESGSEAADFALKSP